MSGNLQKGKESEQMPERQKTRKAQAAPSKGKRYQAAKSSIKPRWEISRNVKKLNEAKGTHTNWESARVCQEPPGASRSRQRSQKTSKTSKRQKRENVKNIREPPECQK